MSSLLTLGCCGLGSLRQNISLMAAPLTLLGLPVLNSGANCLLLRMIVGPWSHSQLAMVVRSIFGLIGGHGRTLPPLLSLLCFRTVRCRRSPSRSSPLASETLVLVGCCHLKSWRSGTASLPSSQCSRGQRTRFLGPGLRPIGFLLSLLMLSSRRARWRHISVVFGGPGFPLRLRFLCGKPCAVGCRSRTKSRKGMAQVRNFVRSMGL